MYTRPDEAIGVAKPSIFVFCLKSAWRSRVFWYRACTFLTTSLTSWTALSSFTSSVAKPGEEIKTPQITTMMLQLFIPEPCRRCLSAFLPIRACKGS
jgi:hypothetical protein